MASVTLRAVTVHHAGTKLLGPVDLEVADGELVAVVGVSGAGKTTLLRAVAGLESVSGGVLELDGVDVTRLAAGERDVAMVFQQPMLLPLRTIGRNIAFPLEVRRRTIDEIRTRVAAEARALHIESLLERAPTDLAAGEVQLVQIARALVRVPHVLLLDEPLAHLDTHLREHMRRELRVLQRGYGVTTLLTTNDPAEAMSMSDRLVMLDDGAVVQVGAPAGVYQEPATLTVALLTGELTVTEVAVSSDGHGFWLRGRDGTRRAWTASLADHVGARLVRGVRADGTHHLFDPATGRRIV